MLEWEPLGHFALQSITESPVILSDRLRLVVSTLSLPFSDTGPVYLTNLLRLYTPSRQPRSSSDSRTLHIPHVTSNTFRHRSFYSAASSVWNDLPREIRHIYPTIGLKKKKKTLRSPICLKHNNSSKIFPSILRSCNHFAVSIMRWFSRFFLFSEEAKVSSFFFFFFFNIKNK